MAADIWTALGTPAKAIDRIAVRFGGAGDRPQLIDWNRGAVTAQPFGLLG